MNLKSAATGYLLGALMAFAAFSYGGDDKNHSTVLGFLKGSAITAKIKADMVADEQVSAINIKVDTDDGGVVQLSGTAKSQTEAERAVSIARNVRGVTSVANNIRITSER